MIFDTTYLLPLSRIEVDTDLLRLIADNKTKLTFDEIRISLISLFELQAKAAKLNVNSKFVVEAIETIDSVFRVEPFYNPKIIEISHLLSKRLGDYIDCIILATAIALKEDLVTEDSRINNLRRQIKEGYGINIINYKTFSTKL